MSSSQAPRLPQAPWSLVTSRLSGANAVTAFGWQIVGWLSERS